MDDQLFDAARNGDLDALTALLDAHPDKLNVRTAPYEQTLLHLAASAGHSAIVELLLRRGLDVDTRDKGDNAYAMHWAAAAGHLDVVRQLADAGGDVVGRDDDHALDVIGWATCFDTCRRDVAEFLLSRGARHHIFSAIAMGAEDDVCRIVEAEPAALSRRMSRNENDQLPLHFAVRMNRREIVSLLIDRGADPLAVDGSGFTAAAYAMTPHVDRTAMEAIAGLTAAELTSAERGARRPIVSATDLVAALALGDWETAGHVVHAVPSLTSNSGALHLMAKRNDVAAVRWLLERGADPNARWRHWDAEVTPLHLAVLGGHPQPARLLRDAGADPRIPDSKHESDAIDWARFFRRPDIVEILTHEP